MNQVIMKNFCQQRGNLEQQLNLMDEVKNVNLLVWIKESLLVLELFWRRSRGASIRGTRWWYSFSLSSYIFSCIVEPWHGVRNTAGLEPYFKSKNNHSPHFYLSVFNFENKNDYKPCFIYWWSAYFEKSTS